VGALSVVFIMVAAATLGTYTARVNVVGQLMPTGGAIRVHAPTSAIVTERNVHEGSAILVGDVMFVLSTETDSAEFAATQSRISTEARNRVAAIEKQIELEEARYSVELKASMQRLANAEQELELLKSLVERQKTIASLADAAAGRYAELQASGLVALDASESRMRDALDSHSKLDSLKKEEIATAGVIADLKFKIAAVRSSAASARNELSRQRSLALQEVVESEARRTVAIKAPVTGIATAVLAEVGRHVDATSPLVTLVPTGSELIAEIYVPSKAIGSVHVGTEVKLQYRAFPYQKYGERSARVESISQATLTARDLGNLRPISPKTDSESNDPFYRVSATIAESFIETSDGRVPLQTGMAFDALLISDRRRLYQWMFSPFVRPTTPPLGVK
jgi:membrane fusion protein